jgi:hypothetical protein
MSPLPALTCAGESPARTGGIASSSWNGSTFTIAAIPEPSTYVAAIGLLALMLWPLRRRLGVK